MALGWYETLQSLKKQIKNICCKLKLIQDSGAGSYKVYTALLTQSGGDNAQVLEGGPLAKGVSYVFDYAEGTWDFTNVGGPKYPDTTPFVATENQEPIDWANTGLLFNTGAPVVTVLENTIGNIWFTYDNLGYYRINSNGLFKSNKTISNVSPNFIYESTDAPYVVYTKVIPNENIIELQSFDNILSANNVIGTVCQYHLEIRVYN